MTPVSNHPRTRNNFLPIILGLLVVALLAAMRVMAEDAAPPREPEPPPWTYQGQKDPFQPPPELIVSGDDAAGGAGAVAVPEKPKRSKEFLESFQLDSLKLVATIFRIEGQPPVAMVEDPMGVGHLVQAGQYLGVNEGRIKEIQDGVLIIEEQVLEKNAPKPTRTVTLKLSKEVVP